MDGGASGRERDDVGCYDDDVNDVNDNTTLHHILSYFTLSYHHRYYLYYYPILSFLVVFASLFGLQFVAVLSFTLLIFGLLLVKQFLSPSSSPPLPPSNAHVQEDRMMHNTAAISSALPPPTSMSTSTSTMIGAPTAYRIVCHQHSHSDPSTTQSFVTIPTTNTNTTTTTTTTTTTRTPTAHETGWFMFH